MSATIDPLSIFITPQGTGRYKSISTITSSAIHHAHGLQDSQNDELLLQQRTEIPCLSS
jgi:hypothetical protein